MHYVGGRARTPELSMRFNENFVDFVTLSIMSRTLERAVEHMHILTISQDEVVIAQLYWREIEDILFKIISHYLVTCLSAFTACVLKHLDNGTCHY